MTIRTFAAAVALVALAPVVAQAGPDVVYYNDNLNSTYIENRGRYIIDGTPGQSDTVCFTQQQGHFSIGTGTGQWHLFFGANCSGTAYPLGAVDMPLDPRTTDEISCEPGGITLSGLTSDFIGAGGDYVQSEVRGASQALCWNKADGSNTSVGVFYGHWMAVVGRDCPMPVTPSATLSLGQAQTCDPTESLRVDVFLP